MTQGLFYSSHNRFQVDYNVSLAAVLVIFSTAEKVEEIEAVFKVKTIIFDLI